jgi:hypothetical protein
MSEQAREWANQRREIEYRRELPRIQALAERVSGWDQCQPSSEAQDLNIPTTVYSSAVHPIEPSSSLIGRSKDYWEAVREQRTNQAESIFAPHETAESRAADYQVQAELKATLEKPFHASDSGVLPARTYRRR